MSLFPFEDEFEDEELEEELPQFEDYTYINGVFKKVVENEAIKVWVKRALLTRRYGFDAYSWDYGSELEELIGDATNTQQFAESQVVTYIEECLLVNPYITAVVDTDIQIEGSRLTVDFTLETVYGEVDVNI